MRRAPLFFLSCLLIAGCESAQVKEGHRAGARGEWREAAEHFAAAAQAEPNRTEVWVFVGHARLAAGERSAAQDAYRKAIALDGSSVPARLGLSRIRVISQDWAGGLEYLKPLLESKTPPADAWVLQAMALLGRGAPQDVKTALEAIDRALAVRPHDGAASYVKGCALLVAKRYEDAQRVFDELEQQPGQEAWSIWGQARLAAAQGRKADVLMNLRRAASLKTPSFELERLLQDPAFAFMKDDPDFQAVSRGR